MKPWVVQVRGGPAKHHWRLAHHGHNHLDPAAPVMDAGTKGAARHLAKELAKRIRDWVRPWEVRIARRFLVRRGAAA